ncbi:MAG: GatB/YqeY domain-containing protein [Litorilinea sp.]
MTENQPQNTSALPLRDRIEADFKQAMRNQDAIAKMTLRAVKTALTEAGKSGADHTLTEDDVLAVIQREAKRRREAAAEYTRLGATAQAAQEETELAVLEGYLPRQLEEAEVEEMARQIIAETGASTPRDLGQVMPKLMARMGAAADGKQASQVVRRLLSV